MKDEFIVPDKVVKTASNCQNVECLSNTEIVIQRRSKLSTSLVTNTCLSNSNKSGFNKKTVNASPIKHICNKSKAGGTYCIARWCGNNAKKSPGISLFRIPKDPDRSVPVLSLFTLSTKHGHRQH